MEESDDLRASELEDDDWAAEHVATVRSVRQAELATRRFELRRERDEAEDSLLMKEQEMQKQMRGVSDECGKLRLEVGLLEKQLSDIVEGKRRELLEISKNTQLDKLTLANELCDGKQEIAGMLRQLKQQRGENARATTSEDDSDEVIGALNHEIDELNRRIYRSDRIFAERSRESKQITESLVSELQAIEARRAELDKNLAAQKNETEKLQQKLEAITSSNESMRETMQNLIESRKAMRDEMIASDEENWKARLQALTNLP